MIFHTGLGGGWWYDGGGEDRHKLKERPKMANDDKIKENTEDQDKAIGERNEKNRKENKNDAPAVDGTVDRNEGRGVKGYDEKNPNPGDIHSDDPLVAGLANGARQGQGKGDEGGVVS